MEPVNVTADADRFTCNAYLVPGERPALVDVGQMPGIVDVVREHVDDLDAVYLTHQHVDHVGELDAVLDAFDADLYCYADHSRRTGALEDGDEVTLGDDTYEVVYTPGHAADHVAFVGEKRLFSSRLQRRGVRGRELRAHRPSRAVTRTAHREPRRAARPASGDGRSDVRRPR
jgi:hydroxyacylglutathione hydrolase